MSLARYTCGLGSGGMAKMRSPDARPGGQQRGSLGGGAFKRKAAGAGKAAPHDQQGNAKKPRLSPAGKPAAYGGKDIGKPAYAKAPASKSFAKPAAATNGPAAKLTKCARHHGCRREPRAALGVLCVRTKHA